jgi:hypothetical protein
MLLRAERDDGREVVGAAEVAGYEPPLPSPTPRVGQPDLGRRSPLPDGLPLRAAGAAAAVLGERVEGEEYERYFVGFGNIKEKWKNKK